MDEEARSSDLGPVPRGPGGPPEGHDYADYAYYRKIFFFLEKVCHSKRNHRNHRNHERENTVSTST